MTTSLQTSQEFEVIDFVEHGYALAGLVAQKLGYGHHKRAREVIQMIFGDWQNRHTFPWKQDIISIQMIEGDEYYDLNTALIGDDATIDILDAIYRPVGNTGDLPIMRIARADYLNIPNKTDEGTPDRFFLRRDLPAPRMYIWQTCGAQLGTIEAYRIKQLYDVTASAQTLDLAKRWSMAVVKRLGYELMPYITELKDRGTDYQNERKVLRGEFTDAFEAAVEENRDTAPTGVYPDGYAPSLWGG